MAKTATFMNMRIVALARERELKNPKDVPWEPSDSLLAFLAIDSWCPFYPFWPPCSTACPASLLLVP